MVGKLLKFYYGFRNALAAKNTRIKLSTEIEPISTKEIDDIGNKMDKFFESLTPSQIVFMGGSNIGELVEEVALTMGITHGFLAKHFERSEMEALQKYYLASWTPERIKEVFVFDIEELKTKFKKVCKDLHN